MFAVSGSIIAIRRAPGSDSGDNDEFCKTLVSFAGTQPQTEGNRPQTQQEIGHPDWSEADCSELLAHAPGQPHSGPLERPHVLKARARCVTPMQPCARGRLFLLTYLAARVPSRQKPRFVAATPPPKALLVSENGGERQQENHSIHISIYMFFRTW